MTRNTDSRGLLSTSKVLFALTLCLAYAPSLQAQGVCEDVSGVWTVDLMLPGTGTSQVTLTLEQTDCQLTGLVEGRNRTEIENGTVEGWTATFTASGTNQATGGSVAIDWEATVEGDSITGSLLLPGMGEAPFTGVRAEG